MPTPGPKHPSPPAFTPASGSGLRNVAMIERAVYAVLRAGFEALASQLAFVDRLFWHLDAAERANIKALLSERVPAVVHGYARRGVDMPLLAISLTNEQEVDPAALGEFLGLEDDDFDESPNDAKQIMTGSVVEITIQTWIYGRTPDEAQYLYQVAWALLKQARDLFLAVQATPGRMSGGDVAPREDLLPDYIYCRMIQASFSGPRAFSQDATFWDGVRVRAHVLMGA